MLSQPGTMTWPYWVTALPLETRAVWHFWGKKQLIAQRGPMRLYLLQKEWLLAEVGVGIAEPEVLVRWWNHYPPRVIWNIGISGALVPGWAVGEWAVIETVCNETGQCYPLRHQGWADARRAVMVSVTKPVMDASQARELFQKCGASLVDMELFTVVHLIRQWGEVPVSSVRVVSDYADEQAVPTIQKHLPQLKHSLRQVVHRFQQKLSV